MKWYDILYTACLWFDQIKSHEFFIFSFFHFSSRKKYPPVNDRFISSIPDDFNLSTKNCTSNHFEMMLVVGLKYWDSDINHKKKKISKIFFHLSANCIFYFSHSFWVRMNQTTSNTKFLQPIEWMMCIYFNSYSSILATILTSDHYKNTIAIFSLFIFWSRNKKRRQTQTQTRIWIWIQEQEHKTDPIKSRCSLIFHWRIKSKQPST